MNGNQTVTVVNKITSLEFTKTDAATGAAMGNVAFKIRGNSGYMKVSQVSAGVYRYSISGSETFHTDSSGKAVIRGLPLGSYTIEESVAPVGYALAASQGATITTSNDRNNPAKASMKNDPLIFEFSKTDALTGKALDGAQFKLITSSGSTLKLRQTAPGEYTPDTSGGETFTTVNGKAIIRYIPKGTYRITETITPTGYATAPDQTVSVGDASIAGNPATATMLDEPLTLEFNKTDSFASTPLDGATFKLLDSGGNAVKLRQTAPGEYSFDTAGGDTFTTVSGKAVICYLPKGAYRVEEAAPPSGFMADTPKPVTIAVNNGTSNPARTSMKDEPLTLEFTKTDALTGALLDGATFKLMRNGAAVRLSETAPGQYRPDPQGSDTFTTSNGKAVIRYLPADTYKIEETAPPTGFMKDAPVDITITPQNGTSNPVKAAMKDAPLTLEFEKLDAFTQKPMDGAQFTLLDASGKPVKFSLYQSKPGFYKTDPNGSDTFTTKDGKATLYYLPEGKYTVREVKAAEGYASTPDKPVTILNTNSPANPAKQSMRDEPLALEIRKLDATDGLPIGGAVFSLLDEDGKTVKVSPIAGKDGYYRPDDKGKDTFEVDATGMAKLLYLPFAVYQVKEVQAPAGFAPSKEAANVTVRETNSVSSPAKLDVKNQPLMFELLKIDAITKEPLPCVSFVLLDKDGKTVPIKMLRLP